MRELGNHILQGVFIGAGARLAVHPQFIHGASQPVKQNLQKLGLKNTRGSRD
jgi:hypothetical protein